MKVLMKCLNEEVSAHRCIVDFHDESWVDEIIVIDGGSTDRTISIISQFPKVKFYIHEWLDWYHDMEVIQSNIAMSYIPHDEFFFILDFDERMSPKLKEFLLQINQAEIDETDLINISRKTVEVHRDENMQALLDEDGWPLISHEIGQYPDYQARLIKRSPEHHWANSPHHILLGWTKQMYVQADIIHYEKDNYNDRINIEKKWARVQARRKELGLTPDTFECNVQPELHKYTRPEKKEGE